MSYHDEKADEKQEEKRSDQAEKEEKYHEKGMGWRSDSLSSVIWALVLIWVGVALLMASWQGPLTDWLRWKDVGGVILVGIALLLVLEIAIRLMIPKYAAPLRGRIILATILGFLGLSNLTNIQLWPLIPIGIGIAILIGGLRRR